MRDAFFDELCTLYSNDDRVVFLTGDLGYKLFDPLVHVDPERVVNFGIREAAMVGFAAGLAKMGRLPFVYSIVPFLTLRCLEQIKLDLCYNRLRAVLVGVGGGFSYGPNGPTHHGVDDLGVMSTLPNMRCLAPATPAEVRDFVREVNSLDSPAYLRLGRNGEANIAMPYGKPGSPVIVREGNDGIIVTTGVILSEVLAGVEQMVQMGIQPKVVHVPTMHPFPEDEIHELVDDGAVCLTIEEHVATGGIGQQVAFALAKRQRLVRFGALTVPDSFPDMCFSRAAGLAWAGLDPESIVRSFRALMK